MDLSQSTQPEYFSCLACHTQLRHAPLPLKLEQIAQEVPFVLRRPGRVYRRTLILLPLRSWPNDLSRVTMLIARAPEPSRYCRTRGGSSLFTS